MSASQSTQPPLETFASIDSALQSGLKDPRERVALLRLEQALLDFMTMDPPVGWMEVGGPANSLVLLPNRPPPAVPPGVYQSSFHRLLVHRLSDRFGIVREKGMILEKSLRLVKVPGTKVPSTLLRDLDPASYAAPPTGDSAVTPSLIMTNKASPTAIMGRSDSGVSGGGKPRKLKIMKRQSSVPLKSSSSSSSSNETNNASSARPSRRVSSSSDLESRERAYAEARARIFSDGTQDGKSPASLTTEQGDATSVPSGNNNAATDLVHAAVSRLSLSEASTGSSSNNNPTSPADAEAATPDQTRAVYRNRSEEAVDPDFQRNSGKFQSRALAAVAFQQNRMYYGNTPSSNQYGYGSAVTGASPSATTSRTPNHLTATAPAFYPGSTPTVYDTSGAWKQSPPSQES